MLYDSLDALPGLLPGIYRGINMHIADTSTEAGRRVLEYLFPGVDAAEYDDFGVLPGIVSIEALMIGDDYKLRAQALQAAFELPGPGLLLHPWLGPMQVILEQPAQISFSAYELRVVRISAVFKRKLSVTSLLTSFASGLSSAISGIGAVASLLALAVGIRIISSARSAAVTRSARIVSSAVASLTPPAGSARAVPQIRATLAASTPATPADFDAWMLRAAAMTAVVNEVPAVAPAASAVVETMPTSQSLLAISLDLADKLVSAAGSAPSDADRALLLSAASHFLASAASQSAYVDYASRREALAFRSRMTSALDALIDQLDAMAAALFQAEASALVRSARSLNVAVVTDISEVLGRLPDVLTFRPTSGLDAWQLALHVAGDTPERMEEVYRDIVARNDPRHASAIDGAIEVLDIR